MRHVASMAYQDGREADCLVPYLIEGISIEGFLFKADVAVLVSRGASNQSHINLCRCLVPQQLPASDVDQLHHVFLPHSRADHASLDTTRVLLTDVRHQEQTCSLCVFPPVSRGSTKVAKPTGVMGPRRLAATSRMMCDTACRSHH